MHFICTPMWTKFYSCKMWALHTALSSPLRSLHAIVPDHSDVVDHLPRPEPVMPSTTQVLSPSPQRHSRARNNITLPKPATQCTWRHSQAYDIVDLCCPRAYNTVVLPEPVMLQSSRRRRTRAVPGPITQCCRPPQARKAAILYIFLCHFGHCFDMLHCFWFAALLWYATLPHCVDMLHCFSSTSLLWYAATLLWYATHCYIAHWRKWAKWDECGNMGQHYCAIKISALNNMKRIGHSIKLKSESI
jgi:hypothetical protein